MAIGLTKLTKPRSYKIDLKREYSVEEFVALPDNSQHYELSEGKLIMAPAPTNRHGRVAGKLYTSLQLFLMKYPIGEVWFDTGFDLGLKPNGKATVLEPDLGFIEASRVPPLDFDGYLPYPDLAVEVWSSKSDLGRESRLKKAQAKIQKYLNAGTRLVWAINPAEKTVAVYHFGSLSPVETLGVDEELDGEQVIPNFKLPIKALFQ